MSEVLGRIVELATRMSVPLLLTCIVLLFVPDDIASTLGLIAIRAEFRPWIGAIAVLSFFISVSNISKLGRGFIVRGWLARRAARKKIIENLDFLSDGERMLLCAMLRTKQRTVYAPITSPIVHGLADKGLLRRARGHGNMVKWPATIPDFVWKELTGRWMEFFSVEEMIDQAFEAEMVNYLKSLGRFI